MILAVTAAGFLVDDADDVDSVMVEEPTKPLFCFLFSSHSLLQGFIFPLPTATFISFLLFLSVPPVPGLWFAGEIKNNKRQRSICMYYARTGLTRGTGEMREAARLTCVNGGGFVCSGLVSGLAGVVVVSV